ncbi:hypothetical protein ACQ4LE_007347 [Meloidogyne hapla]|uniref:DUF148 domain-containing protein n=1 Tax=Meloidogyne hapla TaxID=6305 RepID=A0A1I8B177_MELHA
MKKLDRKVWRFFILQCLLILLALRFVNTGEKEEGSTGGNDGNYDYTRSGFLTPNGQPAAQQKSEISGDIFTDADLDNFAKQLDKIREVNESFLQFVQSFSDAELFADVLINKLNEVEEKKNAITKIYNWEWQKKREQKKKEANEKFYEKLLKLEAIFKELKLLDDKGNLLRSHSTTIEKILNKKQDCEKTENIQKSQNDENCKKIKEKITTTLIKPAEKEKSDRKKIAEIKKIFDEIKNGKNPLLKMKENVVEMIGKTTKTLKEKWQNRKRK